MCPEELLIVRIFVTLKPVNVAYNTAGQNHRRLGTEKPVQLRAIEDEIWSELFKLSDGLRTPLQVLNLYQSRVADWLEGGMMVPEVRFFYQRGTLRCTTFYSASNTPSSKRTRSPITLLCPHSPPMSLFLLALRSRLPPNIGLSPSHPLHLPSPRHRHRHPQQNPLFLSSWTTVTQCHPTRLLRVPTALLTSSQVRCIVCQAPSLAPPHLPPNTKAGSTPLMIPALRSLHLDLPPRLHLQLPPRLSIRQVKTVPRPMVTRAGKRVEKVEKASLGRTTRKGRKQMYPFGRRSA